jgi:GNAT superfamily N-acetyltransferase
MENKPSIANDEARVEPATLEDLDTLVSFVMSLMDEEADFEADRRRQEHGLRLILEQPNRGRIFVLRNDHTMVGMVNLLFTISTAMGGFVINMEDVFIHPDHRRQGYGGLLMAHVKNFAREKGFLRVTLLTDRISSSSQEFFKHHGFTLSEMIPMRLMLAEQQD